ncbi:TetR/AcrR family transcriptional regulator [Streptomyces albireticuli]|uniref:TetR/AcrR family transcriptional regulator n=1 Tax=Streptomyces albireticuli TaxID=1940 RepID=UPI0036A1ECEE
MSVEKEPEQYPGQPLVRLPAGAARGRLIADTALDLLAERGMRGLTHRAVDEAAGLPTGSTSNQARTRLALLEIAVRRLAVREGEVLSLKELPDPAGGPEVLADAIALALHRTLTGRRGLLIARYELALEASRRPELRAIYDLEGRAFREPLVTLLTAAGSKAPERHALSVLAWCEGLMFSCAAGSYHAEVPGLELLRVSARELLRGVLGRG